MQHTLTSRLARLEDDANNGCPKAQRDLDVILRHIARAEDKLLRHYAGNPQAPCYIQELRDAA